MLTFNLESKCFKYAKKWHLRQKNMIRIIKKKCWKWLLTETIWHGDPLNKIPARMFDKGKKCCHFSQTNILIPFFILNIYRLRGCHIAQVKCKIPPFFWLWSRVEKRRQQNECDARPGVWYWREMVRITVGFGTLPAPGLFVCLAVIPSRMHDAIHGLLCHIDTPTHRPDDRPTDATRRHIQDIKVIV